MQPALGDVPAVPGQHPRQAGLQRDGGRAAGGSGQGEQQTSSHTGRTNKHRTPADRKVRQTSLGTSFNTHSVYQTVTVWWYR